MSLIENKIMDVCQLANSVLFQNNFSDSEVLYFLFFPGAGYHTRCCPVNAQSLNSYSCSQSYLIDFLQVDCSNLNWSTGTLFSRITAYWESRGLWCDASNPMYSQARPTKCTQWYTAAGTGSGFSPVWFTSNGY